MSGTLILVSDPLCNRLLRVETTREGRMARVESLREHAAMMLENAVKRIPVVSDSILAAYRAAGKEPVWALEHDVLAKQLCAQLKDYNPTANEAHAAELLRACICAQELGDVPEFKNALAGERMAVQRSDASKRPRRSRLSPFRQRVNEILKSAHRNGSQLDQTLSNWRNDTLDGLRLTYLTSGDNYQIEDENSTECLTETFTYRQLRTAFSS